MSDFWRFPTRSVFALSIALLAMGLAGPAWADDVVPPAPATIPAPVAAPAQAARTSSPGAGETLVGTFRVKAAACSATVSGSYFRMIQPGGTTAGPFVQN